MSDTVSDAELVALAKAGELAAFENLVSRHEQKVYALVLRMLRHPEDAEDVTQEAFMSALEHLAEFRGEASFETWISRIATYAALKVIRKRRGKMFVSLEENTEPKEEGDAIPHPEFIADWRESPEVLAQRNEIMQLIDKALEQVEEKLRLVFLLRDVEGMSIQETAQALEISEANVKVRLLRARLQLREILTRSLGDPSRQIQRATHHDHSE